MASQLVNGPACAKHCTGVFEQNNIVNSARVDDWRPELAIFNSNENAKNVTCFGVGG